MEEAIKRAWTGGLGFDRRADQVGAPERDPGSIPKHLVASEDVGQGRKWHAPEAQVKGLLNLIGPPYAVGQDERRSDGEDLPRPVELDAPQRELELPRPVLVVEVVAGANRLGEQFRMGRDLPVEKFPKPAMIFHAFGVLFFTLEGETGIFSTYGRCGRVCVCSFFSSQTACSFRLSPSIYRFKERPQNPLAPVKFRTIRLGRLTQPQRIKQRHLPRLERMSVVQRLRDGRR
jgi:hypothetical protein